MTTEETTQEPELDIKLPEVEEKEEVIELDYDKAFSKLPSHIKKAAELFNYKPKLESQEKLEEAVGKLKTDYELELNSSVVPLIVAKLKGETTITKPGITSSQPTTRKRTTTPYRGY